MFSDFIYNILLYAWFDFIHFTTRERGTSNAQLALTNLTTQSKTYNLYCYINMYHGTHMSNLHQRMFIIKRDKWNRIEGSPLAV